MAAAEMNLLDDDFLQELESALNNEEIFLPSAPPSSTPAILPAASLLDSLPTPQIENDHISSSLATGSSDHVPLPSSTAKTALFAWLVAQADISSTKASIYSDLLIHSGIFSIKKLVKNIKKNPNILIDLGIAESDSVAIRQALTTAESLPLEKSSTTHAGEAAAGRTPVVPVANAALSLLSPDQLEKSVKEIRTMLQEVIDAQDSFTVEKLAKDACKEIVTVASDSYEGQLALGKAGVCEDLVVLITIYTPSSPRVLQRALCALCALCRRKMDDRSTQCMENIVMLGEVRACQSTISALRKYEDNLVIIKWAAGAIRNLCSLDLNRTRFGTSGACQSLMQIARRYETNEDVLRWIFRAMGNLVNGNNENRTSLIHHGFCEFVIPSMQTHANNALVLADSCWAIRSVALGDEACRSQLIQLKACEIIAENLKTHYHVDFLISEACLALLALSVDAEPEISRLAQEGLCFAFTLPLLGTNDSSQFLSIPHTTCCGEIAAIECLTAIHGFAINDRIRNHFFEAGAGEACACALRCHPQSSEVAIWACKALYKLSSSQSASKKLRRARVCESLTGILLNPLAVTHPDVAEWAGLCVSVLAIDKTNREILAKNNICEAVVKLLRVHEKDPDVAYRMCGAVHFLSIDETIRSQLGDLGACEIVTSVLRTHTTTAATLPPGTAIHEGAVQASSRALGSLACDNPENNLRFANCEVSQVISSAFLTFRTSPAMIEFCCRAISRVCTNSTSLIAFSNLTGAAAGGGGCKNVINALIDFVETDAVVKHALLATLTLTNPLQSDPNASLIIRENIRRFREAQGCLVSIVRAYELHAVSHSLVAQTGSTVFRHLFSEISVNSSGSDSLTKKIAVDACRAMISSMTPHLKSSAVQLEIIAAIAVVSKYGVSESSLGEMNYLTLLVSILLRHAVDSEVVKAIFLTLTELIEEVENIHFICNSVGCGAILTALTTQQRSPELVRLGCQLIEKMSQNDNYRNILNASSTCEILTDLLASQYPPPSDSSNGTADDSSASASNVLAIFSTVTSLCLLDRNTASFSQLPVFLDCLCRFLVCHTITPPVLESCCRIIVIFLAYARFPDQLASLGSIGATEDEDHTARPSASASSSASRGKLNQRPSLSQLNLFSSKNILSDEPSVAFSGTSPASSSPRRRYHNQFLSDVAFQSYSQFSQNSIYSGNDPPSLIPQETYPNLLKFLERKLEVIYGNLLLKHPDNEVLVWLIFEGYSFLTMDEGGVKAITAVSELNLCELICRLFGTFITKSERVESAAAKVLTNIAATRSGEGDYTELLGQLGACSLLPLYLKNYYTTSPEAVRIGCSAMAYLCKHNGNNRISLAANGSCEIVFSCLQKFIFNPSIVTHVVHAIKCLCSQNKLNTTSFSSLGTVDFLIENLLGTELLVGDNALLGSTLWCLGHIPPAVLSHLWSQRVTDFVMTAFSDHFNDLSSSALTENGYVIMSACDAVYTLCSYVDTPTASGAGSSSSPSNSSSSVSHQSTIFAKNDTSLCEVMVSILRFYEHDENILHSALMALANLLDRIPENQQRIQEVMILKTMQVRCQSLVVVRGALAALLGIVHGNPHFPEKLSSVAAIKIILKGIFLHSGDPIVAKRGSSLIAILSSHDKVYQRVLGSEGACGILLDLLKEHSNQSISVEGGEGGGGGGNMDMSSANITVMREGCWALFCLCHQHDSNRSKILLSKDGGGLEFLSLLLKAFSGNESILVWVCGTIANLTALHTSSHAARYLELGLPSSLLEIIQIYGLGGELGSEAIVKHVCWAISNLALVSSLSEALGTQGTCEQLVLVLLKHLEQVSVVEMTLLAMKNLLKNSANKKRFEESGLVALLDQAQQTQSAVAAAARAGQGGGQGQGQQSQEEVQLLIRKVRNILVPPKTMFSFGGREESHGAAPAAAAGERDKEREREREREERRSASGGESVSDDEEN